jgi:hypothetical protein
MIACPVQHCESSFLNKYSLTNHLRKSLDPSHNVYYKNNVEVKFCPICTNRLENRRKFTNAEGLCYTCFKNKYPTASKTIEKKWQKKICFGCGREIEGFFSNRNTRALCNICQPLSKKRKKGYNQNFDKIRYERNKKERTESRLEKNGQELKELYALIKNDLLETDLPIHKLCDNHHISLLSIRKILPLLMSETDYEYRNHRVRSMAVQLRIEDLKNFLKNRPEPRQIVRTPTSIEKKIGEAIQKIFPEAAVRYNVWKTLRDEPNNCYIHLESDVIANFGKIRIIILSDGEAFHGGDCYFNGNTIKEDDRKSRILHERNPFVLRYSETEIEKGFAIPHITEIINKIRLGEISNYYRNWMTEVEEQK